MKILVINAGSSSLKYQLFDMDNKEVLAKGNCERIGLDGVLKHKTFDRDKYVLERKMDNHTDAIKLVIEVLTSKEQGVISDLSEISAVGHRVLHGGEAFSQSTLIDSRVLEAIKECIPLGPLHNPANLAGILTCREVMGNIPQVAVFDTAFHQTMPKHAYTYALPYEYYKKYKIRRYGFHGTSHRYVTSRVSALVGKDVKDLKVVTCHLGNGSSIAAIDGGKCVDTSMGLTPLEGLIMGTRCGSIDPAIVTFIAENEGLSPIELDKIMNKKSGVLGLSGVSSDFRDLEDARDNGNERAALALQMFSYQVTKYVGSYAAAMGGLDVVVFTAGVGENNPELREEVIDKISFMGASIDKERNKIRGKELDVSAADSRIKTLVIPTNEELMIALDTQSIISDLVK